MRTFLVLLATAAMAAPTTGLQRDVDAIHELGLPGVQARLVTEDGRHHVATSGIGDDFPDYTTEAEFLRHRYDVYTPEQLVARAMAHEPDFKPGKGWGYSS